MIKAEITKNIIHKSNNPLGISLKQIIVCVCAFATGIIMYLGLRKYINTEVLMTLIFIVLALIIGFGCINMQGMSLAKYFYKLFFGKDFRPYVSKGVFSNESVQKKEK